MDPQSGGQADRRADGVSRFVEALPYRQVRHSHSSKNTQSAPPLSRFVKALQRHLLSTARPRPQGKDFFKRATRAARDGPKGRLVAHDANPKRRYASLARALHWRLGPRRSGVQPLLFQRLKRPPSVSSPKKGVLLQGVAMRSSSTTTLRLTLDLVVSQAARRRQAWLYWSVDEEAAIAVA